MKRKIVPVLAALFAAMSVQATTTVDKPVVVATGDSYTRITKCNGSYNSCDSQGNIPHDRSYSTYLNSTTQYRVAMSDNTARGGETCTTQAAYTSGIYAGYSRGLRAQAVSRIVGRDADLASVLIGINDVNQFGVSQAELELCLVDLYDTVTSGGQKLVAMTYPGVSTSTTVWNGALPAGVSGPTASANVSVVNAAIRNAVAAHNLDHPARPVILAETSAAWSASAASSFTDDGVHPTVKGAKRLAKVWFDEVCTSSWTCF